MSNTWDYRFAFYVSDPQDVPEEFRRAYAALTEKHGAPNLAFFSPALSEAGFFTSRLTPPRLWLVFPETIALLSLEGHPNAVSKHEVRRQDLLGFGQADFLLNCWFSILPGSQTDGDGPLKVRYPSRASGKYQALARTLLGWMGDVDVATAHSTVPQLQSLQAGLPSKFSHCIEEHPELWNVIEQFFQPQMINSKTRNDGFANLLLAVTSRFIVALSEQHEKRRSEYGIGIHWFPLARVKLAEWIDEPGTECCAIRISLGGPNSHVSVSWNVFGGLKPYALRWISAVESCLLSTEQHRNDVGRATAADAQAVRCVP